MIIILRSFLREAFWKFPEDCLNAKLVGVGVELAILIFDVVGDIKVVVLVGDSRTAAVEVTATDDVLTRSDRERATCGLNA